MSLKNDFPQYKTIVNILLSESKLENGGFGNFVSDGNIFLDRYFASLGDNEIDTIAQTLIKITSQMSQAMTEIYLKRVESKSIELSKKLKEPIVRISLQQTFTTTEVITISGKNKNTINSHLNSGKLKGEKNASGEWVIQREELAKYVMHDNF